MRRPPRSSCATDSRQCRSRPRGPRERRELALPALLHLNAQVNVRPVEARNEGPDIAGQELALDVLPGDFVGGRGEGGHRQSGKQILEAAEVFILGAEGGAPRRHAMRLVDDDEPERQPGDRIQHLLGHQPLRREIEQLDLTVGDAGASWRRSRPVLRRIDGFGGNAGKLQRGHLVPHQATSGDTTMVSPSSARAGTW